MVLVVQDAFTEWLQSYPCKSKAVQEVILSIKRFLGPNGLAKHAYSDNAIEFIKAKQEMGILHDTCTPHRSETFGIIERVIRRVKEGTSTCLVQSGQ